MEENLPTERVDVGDTRSEVARATTTDPSEPLVVIGYWAEQGKPDSPYPDPHELIDPDQPREERFAVVDYLTRGLVARAYMGLSRCRICGEPKNGNLELTDGAFLWPEGLAHYVRDHNVRLPTAFVEHIAQQDDHLSSRTDDRARWWRRNADRVGLREVFPPDEDDDPDDRPQRSNAHGQSDACPAAQPTSTDQGRVPSASPVAADGGPSESGPLLADVGFLDVPAAGGDAGREQGLGTGEV